MNGITEIHQAKDPNNVLEMAKGEYESVLIIGWDHKGSLDVRASTNINNKDVLWLVEQFKAKLINGEYERVEG